MTQLTENIWAIEVPNYIPFESIFIDENNLLDSWNPHYKGGSQLPEGNWQLIGCINADEMDFDSNRVFPPKEGWPELPAPFNDYAFRTFLSSKGLHWVNPLGEVEPQITDPDISSQYYSAQLHEAYNWQQAENSLIKGKLVIIQKL